MMPPKRSGKEYAVSLIVCIGDQSFYESFQSTYEISNKANNDSGWYWERISTDCYSTRRQRHNPISKAPRSYEANWDSRNPGNIQVSLSSFGIISRPWRTLKFHLKMKEQEQHWKYLIISTWTTSALEQRQSTKPYQIHEEAKGIFLKASMNLREWASISHESIQTLPDKLKAKRSIGKILGLVWNTTVQRMFFITWEYMIQIWSTHQRRGRSFKPYQEFMAHCGS